MEEEMSTVNWLVASVAKKATTIYAATSIGRQSSFGDNVSWCFYTFHKLKNDNSFSQTQTSHKISFRLWDSPIARCRVILCHRSSINF